MGTLELAHRGEYVHFSLTESVGGMDITSTWMIWDVDFVKEHGGNRLSYIASPRDWMERTLTIVPCMERGEVDFISRDQVTYEPNTKIVERWTTSIEEATRVLGQGLMELVL